MKKYTLAQNKCIYIYFFFYEYINLTQFDKLNILNTDKNL
jgi:hypothetical protein